MTKGERIAALERQIKVLSEELDALRKEVAALIIDAKPQPKIYGPLVTPPIDPLSARQLPRREDMPPPVPWIEKWRQ